jgi:cytochrome c peroxidase
MLLAALLVGPPTAADQLPPDASYRPLPTLPFEQTKVNDEAQKPQVMQRQEQLLNQRYDLSDQPVAGVMMSGGRRAVQGGVRVKLSQGVTWSRLAEVSPQEIRERGLLPLGFLPLPHVDVADSDNCLHRGSGGFRHAGAAGKPARCRSRQSGDDTGRHAAHRPGHAGSRSAE